MPTTRPRHMITETDAVAAALDRAARRWPNLSRIQLVTRLVQEADAAACDRGAQRREHLRSVLHNPDPRLIGIGDSSSVREMRDQDWPE